MSAQSFWNENADVHTLAPGMRTFFKSKMCKMNKNLLKLIVFALTIKVALSKSSSISTLSAFESDGKHKLKCHEFVYPRNPQPQRFVILTVQNIFYRNPVIRTVSLNAR